MRDYRDALPLHPATEVGDEQTAPDVLTTASRRPGVPEMMLSAGAQPMQPLSRAPMRHATR
jgi:hypothetical protein